MYPAEGLLRSLGVFLNNDRATCEAPLTSTGAVEVGELDAVDGTALVVAALGDELPAGACDAAGVDPPPQPAKASRTATHKTPRTRLMASACANRQEPVRAGSPA